MKLYLGVDSGGTKTKFLLVNEEGIILAESIQPASHYLQVGFDGLKKVMMDGMLDCLQKTGHQKEEIQAVFASCAGYGDILQDTDRIEETIRSVFDVMPCQIGNDMENAFAGSLGGKDGINVIAGTGSIGMGRDESGNIFRSGGWHHAFGGDEGSAYWLACRLILAYTRQSDGRDEKTRLYSYINEKYGLKDDSEILKLTIQDWDFDRTKVAQMAKDVYELACEEDIVALQIYKDAAKELADIYVAIKRNLQFAKMVKASYSGGVFKSKKYIIEPLQVILAKENIELVTPLLEPDGGSALLALQLGNIEITDTIIKNLGKS